MSADEKDGGGAGKTTALADSGDAAVLTAALGFPVPPTVAGSIVRSISALIEGIFGLPIALVDIPNALLEQVSTGIRSRTKAKAALTAAVGKTAGDHFADDPARIERAIADLGKRYLPAAQTGGGTSIDTGRKSGALGRMVADSEAQDRAARHAANRLLWEQANRESVAEAAVEDLKSDPPSSDTAVPISDDWLQAFGRLAESRSAPEMQAYFAKILAGEIRAPGSFAQSTLDVAGTLTTDVALMFQRFCDCSLALVFGPFVFAEPFGGNPGSNTLGPVGLSYDVLTQLQDAGLVRSDLSSYYTLPPSIFLAPFEIAGVRYRAVPKDASAQVAASAQRLSIIHFTRAGSELRRIVHMTPNRTFVEKLAEYLGRFGFDLQPLPVP